MALLARGSLPEIIRNDHRLYQGNLTAYFQVIFNYGQNLQHPYHNFRHMFQGNFLIFS